MRNLTILLLVISVTSAFSQNLINTESFNPLAQGSSLIRMVHIEQDQLYIGGNISFINGELTAPIVRINTDGTLDQSYQVTLANTNNLANNLTQPSIVVDGELFFQGDFDVKKLNADGSTDESFSLFSGQNVQNFVSYRDSLLVLSSSADLRLVADDGNFRTIETGLTEDNNLFSISKLSENKILLLAADKVTSDSKYYLFNDELILDESFSPVDVGSFPSIRNVELLPNGLIFIVGKKLTVNGVEGNGIYYIDSSGSIDASSPHNTDISFIDSFDNGIEHALPLSDGKTLIVGRANPSDFNVLVLGRLLSSGARDDTFVSKSFKVRENLGTLFIEKDSNEDLYVVMGQTSYDGQTSRGINKINTDGENIVEFDVSISGQPRITQFESFAPNQFVFSGNFSETKNSNLPHLSAFSPDATINFPWLESVDLANDDIMGTAKVLSNGDIIIGAYDRNSSEVIKVYNPDGTQVDLGLDQPTALFVESPVLDIHESENFIYASGIFTYTNDSESRRSIIKFNKDYSFVAGYNASLTSDQRVPFSYLTEEDKLIANIVDINASTSDIVRLMPDGSKDNTFNDIPIGGNIGFGSQVFSAYDSLLLFYESDFNNPQPIQVHNMNGELLDESLVTINADGSLSDVQSINDSTLLISGSFTSVNNIPKAGLALIGLNGAVYDDLTIHIEGTVNSMEIAGDTLFLLGPGKVNNTNGGGFYALSTKPNALEIESTSITENAGIELIWNDDISIRTIDVVRTDSNDNEELLASLEKGTTSFTDETAAVNTLYEYQLISKNVLGQNTTSTSIEIIQPATPSGLAVEFSEGDNILTWTDASDNEVGFEVYRSMSGEAFEKISEVDMNGTSYTDENIQIDNEFSYYLVAPSANFQSEPSDTVEISVFRPDAPINGQSELTSGEQGTVDLSISWENGDSETDSFIILESLDNMSFDPLDTVDVSITSFSKNATVDAFYYYQILARNEVGNSDPSSTIEVDAFRPDAPGSLSSEFDDDTQIIDLAWVASGERATSFIIYESLDNQTFSPIDTVDASILEYARNVSTIDIFYYYYIVASNTAGNSSPSSTLEVNTTVLGSEIGDFQNNVYPNPSKGSMTVSMGDQEVSQLVISDLNGKIVRSIEVKNQKETRISGLTIGTYIMQFLSGNSIVETQKLIVVSE